MANEAVVVGIVTGVIVGVASSVVAQRALRARDELIHHDEVHSAGARGFDDGWHAALNDKGQVRAAFKALFPQEGETEIRSHRR